MLFRLKNPALLLAALLQVLPVVRTFCTNPATVSSFAIVLRWTLGSTAALSAVDAVSGATTVYTSPASFSGTVGTPFSNNVVVAIGGGNKAAKDDYFILASGSVTSPLLLNGQSTTLTLPPGLTFLASWVNGASTIGGIIYGTPTTAGSYPTTVTIVSPGNASLPQKITITISGSVTPTAPAITTQPADSSVIAGNSATFTVAASGTAPLGYFWSKGGAPLANGGNLSGANTATLTIASVTAADAGNYSVLVSNSVNTATSTSAALTVISPPAITSQPAAQTQATGGSAQFAVTASGSAPLNYRWLRGGSGLTNGVKFSGVNSNLLTITAIAAADAGNYSVAITNVAGSITSSVAALTVVASPTIVTPPASQTVIAGASASFSVNAAGSTPLVYRWLKNSTPLAEGGNVSGSATATLTLSGVGSGDAAGYSVTVSNSLGSVTSSAATLTVAFVPAIVTPPAAVTALTGSNAAFTVTASGTAPLSYQWLKNGVAISGATSATLSLANVSAVDAANYSVTVTNAVGGITSGSAALTVLIPPAITAQPANLTVAAGSSASFSATASGTGPLDFQWLKNGVAIPGANSNVLTLAIVTTNDAGIYSTIVTNLAGSAPSSSATLTVLIPPAITLQPVAASVVAGTNVSFTVAASGSAPLIYQWRKNGAVLANGGNVSGATTAALSLAGVAATDAANYSVTVTNAVGSATSSNAALTVLGPPVITAQPANVTVALGSPASFSVTAAGTGPLSFQWLKNGAAIAGANSNTLAFSAVTTNDTAVYFVVVTNSVGNVSSFSASLAVLVPPAIVTPPVGANVIAGTNVTFTVIATGSPTLAYQWRKNGGNLANGGNVSGATSGTLVLTSVSATDAASYSVTVTNAVGSATSAGAALNLVAAPVITLQPTNQVAALGSTITLAVAATGTGPLSYQWFTASNALADGGTVSGSTSNVLTITTLTTNDLNTYFVVVSNFLGSATSSNASLTAVSKTPNLAPVITTQPLGQFAAPNQTVVLTVAATGTGPLLYQWRKNGAKLANGGNVSGATTASLTLASVKTKNNGSYSVIVSNPYGSATSATAALSVLAPPAIIQSPASRTAKAGGSVTFTVKAKGGAMLSYRWFKDGKMLVDGEKISGSATKLLKISSLTARDSADYFVAVSNPAASARSGKASLTVLVPVSSNGGDNENKKTISPRVLTTSQAAVNAVIPETQPAISLIVQKAGGITLNCTGTPGSPYLLQATSDFAAWTNISTNTADANGQWQVTDAAGAPSRYYRIRTAP